MPEHLKIGVAADSVLLSVWARAKHPFDLTDEALLDLLEGWETSRLAPVRQYARLLGSLVIFAENEFPEDGGRMSTLATEVLIIGSGAGGAVTAATPGRGGPQGHGRRGGAVGRSRRLRAVLARGDGREVPPRRFVRGARPPGDRVRRGPVRRRQHRDQQRPLPPPPARARRGVAARVPDRRVRHRRARPLRGPRSRTSSACRACPGAPPASSAVLERGAAKLGWRAVEFSRVFRYESNGRAVKQTMARTMLPERDRSRRRSVVADCRVPSSSAQGDRVVGAHVRAHARRRHRSSALLDPRRPRVRLRGRDPDARAAAAQRHPRATSATG